MIKKFIAYSYYIYLLLLPLVFYPFTSELFEFNKMVFTYIFTSLVVFLWITRMILEKNFCFKKTFMDIPIILFLTGQIISTIFSMDIYTSVFGYYSRFNGGLLSYISYALIYWVYVSNMDKKSTMKTIKLLLFSTFMVGVYAVLQHFGIDKHLWVQDVQNRVFSSFGQPNWLAAWTVAIIPFVWSSILIKKQVSARETIILTFISAFFYMVVLYTKSRSGLIAFYSITFIYWLTVIFFQHKFAVSPIRSLTVKFFMINIAIIILTAISGTPWTSSYFRIFDTVDIPTSSAPESSTLLELGGTESGEIRKIVWKGALDVWRNNFFFGSGVETFAYSYYGHRPAEHNLVSEWDFLYNKTHNEYLNFLATTGIIGTLFYIIFLVAIIVLLIKPHIIATGKQTVTSKSSLSQSNKTILLNIAFMSAVLSILITNFFGFSVVGTSVLLFIIPAMSVSLKKPFKNEYSLDSIKYSKLSIAQMTFIGFLTLIWSISMILVSRYWYADLLYAKGKAANRSKNYSHARSFLHKSISYSPLQANYYDELSHSATGIAVSYFDIQDVATGEKFAMMALDESKKALQFSPYNIPFRKNRANIYIQLSVYDPLLLDNAIEEIKNTIVLSPTDAKLYYNLGLAQARAQYLDEALISLEKAIELKSNYRDARFATGIISTSMGNNLKAVEQYRYILSNINPNDTAVQQQLEEIN